MDSALSLDSLAIAINAAHERCQRPYVTMLADARSTGELLLQAKSQVSHGQWTAWLTSNCAFSDRTAQRYMQIASSWDSLQSKTATVADLGVRMACEMIAGDSQLEKQDKLLVRDAAPKPKNNPTYSGILPGDRIKVTDEESPEYGQELEVSEVVQDAIALFKKGNETYPLLINQVEVVERPTPPTKQDVKPIDASLERPGKNVNPPLKHEEQTKNNSGLAARTPMTAQTLPRTLPSGEGKAYQSALAGDGRELLGESGERLTSIALHHKEITVANLQDLLRRILDECGEYLSPELIDLALELLK